MLLLLLPLHLWHNHLHVWPLIPQIWVPLTSCLALLINRRFAYVFVCVCVCILWRWFWASKPRASSEASLLSFLLLCSHFQLLSPLSSLAPWRVCLVSYLSILHFLCTNEQICACLRAFFFLLEEYTTGIFLNWALVTSQHFLEIPSNQTAELALPLLTVV